MKRLLFVLGVLAFGAVASAQATAVKICDATTTTRCLNLVADGGVVSLALPTSPAGVQLDQTVMRTFSSCPAAGSSVQVIPDGKYLLVVTGENTTLCLRTTCDGGYGTLLPANFAMLESFVAADGGTVAACASSGTTGVLSFTKSAN